MALRLTGSQRLAGLGAPYVVPQQTTPIAAPYVVAFNADVAALLDMPAAADAAPGFADVFAGNRLPAGAQPVAHRYAGHQFGVWAGQLGDGRAVTLGSIENKRGEYWEVQLKGAGQTPFSRFADGRAVLCSTIREYLVSEAMAGLGIPSTRALAIIGSARVPGNGGNGGHSDPRVARADPLRQFRMAVLCQSDGCAGTAGRLRH